MTQNMIADKNVSTALPLTKNTLARNSRQVRFGFELVNGRLEECPEEKRVLSHLRKWWTQGLSYNEMAIRLDDLGISTKREENHWSAGFVAKLVKREVLSDEIYCPDSEKNTVAG